MAIFSNPKTSLAGTFWLSIDNPGMDTNVEITDLGQLTYEFDLVPTQQSGARVGGIAGAMTVKLWDQMSNRGSFYDSMEEYIGTYDATNDLTFPRANCNVVWLSTRDDQTYRFPFSLSFSDIGIDERSQTATVKLQPKTTNINIGNWGEERAPLYVANQVPYVYKILSYVMNIDNCVPTSIAIQDIVGTLDSGFNVSNIYETATNIGTVQATSRYGTVVTTFDAFPTLARAATLGNGTVFPIFIFNGVTSTSYDPTRSMFDVVKQYAAMEGAIFGSAFNVNFYINRTSNIYNVEFSNNEIADLSFVTVPRAYNTVAYTTRANDKIRDGIGFLNVNINYEAWRDAPQQQSFDFTNYDPYMVIGCLEFDGGVSYGYSYVSNSGPIESNVAIRDVYQDSLFTRSFQAFAAPLGITATNRSALRIEATILGADKVRPYEVIKFDNTVPIRYQGKHFRPTSLSYDLKADKVKVTAYQIDTVEIIPPEPPPPTTTNVNIGVCETGEYMASVTIKSNTTADFAYSNENGTYMMFGVTGTNATAEFAYSNENGTYMVFDLYAAEALMYLASNAENTATNFSVS